jgi:hypothetical protein
MEIELKWQKELPLKHNSKDDAYELDLESIAEAPGIYIFGRRHSTLFEALYVGKVATLRDRIKTQLNNHKLLTHVWNAKTGRRIVMLGEFKAKPNQKHRDCLPIAEKALIRYFVSKGHDLVNVHGVTLRHHGVSSTGAHKVKDFPNYIQVEVA